MTGPIIRGQYGELIEQPGSPDYDFGEKSTCRREFEGPFEQCLSSRPRYGDNMEDTGNFVVVRARVRRVAAGHGELSIDLEAPGYERDGQDTQEETYEIDWLEVDRPLLLHPRYQTGGDSELTDADRVALELWRNETVKEWKESFFYDPTGNGNVSGLEELSDNAKNAAAKYLKGNDSYRDWHPVARINSLHTAIPNTEPCGRWQDAKPFPQCPSGYQWMKTADRPLRSGTSGRWIRNIEFTGFKDIDADLYDEIGGGA